MKFKFFIAIFLLSICIISTGCIYKKSMTTKKFTSISAKYGYRPLEEFQMIDKTQIDSMKQQFSNNPKIDYMGSVANVDVANGIMSFVIYVKDNDYSSVDSFYKILQIGALQGNNEFTMREVKRGKASRMIMEYKQEYNGSKMFMIISKVDNSIVMVTHIGKDISMAEKLLNALKY